jgi:hypothetical protein
MVSPSPQAITHQGQEFYDEPVKVWPTPIASSVQKALGARPSLPVTVGYERVKLRWMKPDGQGGLVPVNNWIKKS